MDVLQDNIHDDDFIRKEIVGRAIPQQDLLMFAGKKIIILI